MGTITARPATSAAPARPRLRVIPGGAGEGGRPAGVRPPVRSAGSGEGRCPTGGCPPVRRAGSRGDRPRLRLTRRGRLVVRVGLVALTALAILMLVLLLSRSASAGDRGRVIPARYHVVLPGETLWGIAGEIAPEVDRREIIAEIVELNALPGSGVDVGQRIALPTTG